MTNGKTTAETIDDLQDLYRRLSIVIIVLKGKPNSRATRKYLREAKYNLRKAVDNLDSAMNGTREE